MRSPSSKLQARSADRRQRAVRGPGEEAAVAGFDAHRLAGVGLAAGDAALEHPRVAAQQRAFLAGAQADRLHRQILARPARIPLTADRDWPSISDAPVIRSHACDLPCPAGPCVAAHAPSLLVLGSCATPASTPDRSSARAAASTATAIVAHDGHDRRSRRRSDWFTRGLLQTYAFNDERSRACLQGGARRRPRLRDVRVGRREGAQARTSTTLERGDLGEARRYIAWARQRTPSARTPRERALIDAMSDALRRRAGRRCGRQRPERCRCARSAAPAEARRPHPLDIVYAERMRAHRRRLPGRSRHPRALRRSA